MSQTQNKKPGPPVRPEIPKRRVDIPGMSPGPAERSGPQSEGKKLIVGREICLSGEITACEKLVVEGRVEAALSDSQSIEIASTGHFKGSAEVSTADISGEFEGKLTARKRLVVRASGHVSGEVRYGEIEVERGGVISGEVRALHEPGARTGEGAQAASGEAVSLAPERG